MRAGLALAAAAALAGPAHAAGPRIVSLNPCSDAILAEVADPAQILALSAYSRDPASSSMAPGVAARFATTHGTAEEVLALHPDVVIDGAFVAPATAGAYRRLGLRLETIGTQHTVAGSLADVRRLAALAGHPDRGEALVRRIDAALAAAAPPRGTAPIDAVLWEAGGMVAGTDTLTGELLERTGFANLPARQGYRQADIYPIERLLAHPPRVLLTVGNDRMLHHPALAALTGTVRAPFPAGLLYCGGPTIIRAAERLAALRRALVPNPGAPHASGGSGPSGAPRPLRHSREGGNPALLAALSKSKLDSRLRGNDKVRGTETPALPHLGGRG